jgi:hypothetical protein
VIVIVKTFLCHCQNFLSVDIVDGDVNAHQNIRDSLDKTYSIRGRLQKVGFHSTPLVVQKKVDLEKSAVLTLDVRRHSPLKKKLVITYHFNH